MTCLFLAAGVLSIVVPALVHEGLLPGGLESPWLLTCFLLGVLAGFVASLGFWIHAKRRHAGRLVIFLYGALALLLGAFGTHLLVLWT